jgi:hypothetical protein
MNANRSNRVSRSALGLLALVTASLLCATAVTAVAPVAGQETVDERTQRLQRDEELIEVLVQGGIDLAGEDDPLKRADQCNVIADALAREIKRAVGKKDGLRAALLGEQMQAILEQGVVVNLHQARETLAPDSPAEEQINKLGQKVANSARSIEEEVSSNADPDRWRPTLEAVTKAKTAVQDAVKGKGKGKGKDKEKEPPHKKGKM